MAQKTITVSIHTTADNSVLYTATATIDTTQYPPTAAGQSAFETDATNGNFALTVDNGAVIPAGQKPPLVKPSASTGAAAFSQKLESEAASGTGTAFADGSASGGQEVGTYSSASDYKLYTVTGAPIAAANYQLLLGYQTNTAAAATANIIVNGVVAGSLALQGAEGGKRTATMTISLNAGTNTIRVEGQSGTFIQDYINVTRAAS